MDKVAAVVVTYNRLTLLKKNLASLMNQKCDIDLDILVIDNLSTDGTGKYVKGIKDYRIKYFCTGKNIGGAGGFNYGMRKAVEAGYKWIWLMDDDTVPEANALQELLKVDSKLQDDYGFISSRVLWKDGTQCLMNCPKYKNKTINQDNLQSSLTHITQASFVSLLIRRNTVKVIGLPIKDFFIWGDDVEYTRRISLRYNKKCYIVRESIVYHLMNINRGSNIAIDDISRISRYRYAYRNEGYTFRQEGMYGRSYYLLKCLFNLLRILLKSRDCKKKRINTLIKGIIDGIHFNPSIERI